LHCGSNNSPTVGQFVDAHILVSLMVLPIQVCVMQTVRVMTMSFWIIYIPTSKNLVLLHQIHPQVMVGRPFMMVLVALILQSKCSGR